MFREKVIVESRRCNLSANSAHSARGAGWVRAAARGRAGFVPAGLNEMMDTLVR